MEDKIELDGQRWFTMDQITVALTKTDTTIRNWVLSGRAESRTIDTHTFFRVSEDYITPLMSKQLGL